jgi:hypothetical protein
VADMSVPQRQRPWPAINSDTEYFWEGVPLGEIRIGLPVTVEFTEVEPGLTLPVFRPAE